MSLVSGKDLLPIQNWGIYTLICKRSMGFYEKYPRLTMGQAVGLAIDSFIIPYIIRYRKENVKIYFEDPVKLQEKYGEVNKYKSMNKKVFSYNYTQTLFKY